MPRWLFWLARLIGAGVTMYGVWAIYRVWWWGHVGLYMRTFAGETPWQIEFQRTSFLLFHTTRFLPPSIILISGVIILALAWRE